MSSNWTQIVTWLIVVGGWYTVHKAALHRDRRKEKRDISAKVCSSLSELQTAAIDFHTAPHCDVRKSTDLAQQVEQLAIQLQRCPMNELDLPLGRIVTLRQRITRQNIDPTDFSPQMPDSPIVLEIRNAITDIVGAIEGAREDKWK